MCLLAMLGFVVKSVDLVEYKDRLFSVRRSLAPHLLPPWSDDYPPDFDPSKIPRNKDGPRNKTFTIRLMAPCNMRCTTCGEYIYKGRKFNSRKEDVDDMNHLGLRIYRFYIKCTSCLSEISFRTDPANTDYVLEAGATRNFEALSKAEKQAEAEEK